MSNFSFCYNVLNSRSSVGSNAGCQSRGCEFEPQLGQHSFRRLTKVTVTSVIRLSPMGQQSMWKSSQLLGTYVVWCTGVIIPGNRWIGELAALKIVENGVKPQSINQCPWDMKFVITVTIHSSIDQNHLLNMICYRVVFFPFLSQLVLHLEHMLY